MNYFKLYIALILAIEIAIVLLFLFNLFTVPVVSIDPKIIKYNEVVASRFLK